MILETRRQRIIVAIGLVALILLVAAFAYVDSLVSSLRAINNNPALPSPTVSGYLNSPAVLSYNNGSFEYPYVSVIYRATNAVQVYANASIYNSPTPTHLYILNFTNDCYNCGNATQAVEALISGIKGYGMIGLYANTSNVSVANLNQIDNNSILVIVSGYIPEELESGNFSLLDSLLARHTSIIYVGFNFSQLLISDSGSTPGAASGVPGFLRTYPVSGQVSGGPFTFNTPVYVFRNGTNYHSLTYVDYANGTLVAFPNTLSSWPTEQQAGSDLAKAIWQMFWLPRYSYGSSTGKIPQGGSGSIGVVMNATAIPYNLDVPSVLNSGFLRVVVRVTPLYTGKPPAYMYIEGQPSMATRGVVAMQPFVYPNESQVAITFNVTAKPKKPINLSTFITVFNQNLSIVSSVHGPSIHGFSSTSPAFTVHQNLNLGPGRYIVMLGNFSDNTSIAEGYFVIPRYNISLIKENLTAGIYIFKIGDNGRPLNNIQYSISVNNAYPTNGIVKSGLIAYTLPPGTPQITGKLNFTINMLGQRNTFSVTNRVQPFLINSEYIELGIVLLMIVIMIVFVRAPQRDEFYIDVPNLPESKKIEINLKAGEVLAVFDKLNANYHWKYMPLNKTEMKSAIAINLKYNNIPVELTYRNIDTIMDSLLVKGYVVGADELYAPAAWIGASKHDIEYLATFKKLRIYFVTHSYTFTDIDFSDEADLVAMLHGDKKYVVIYSRTSRFKNIPIYPGTRTHLVFLNSDAMEEFKTKLYSTSSVNAEKLKMYISADFIRLVDADNIGKSIG